MEKVVSATEAKTHLGTLIRRATEDGETIIVERSGIPRIAIVAIDEFQRLKGGQRRKDREIALHRIRGLKKIFHDRLMKEGRELPDISLLINDPREERDGEIIDGLR